MQKGRYLVSEFLKNPVSWLETESLYHSLHNAERGPRRAHQYTCDALRAMEGTDFALGNKLAIKASVKLDELLGALIRG
jgi:hypothetical protein